MTTKAKDDRRSSQVQSDNTLVTIIPSPVILFPQGRLRLTIYQPEYLSILAEGLKRERQLVLSFQSNDHGIQQGISVSLVDFDQDKNKYLTIDVQGEYLVYLTNVEKNSNGIWLGEAQALPHWTTISKTTISKTTIGKTAMTNSHGSDEQVTILAQHLQQLFENKREVSDLYPQKEYQHMEWVCARLLELTPMPYKAKLYFLAADSFIAATDCLKIIFKEK